mgnify:CR=1 FL=1
MRLLTNKEIAELRGVTEQAVYKMLDGLEPREPRTKNRGAQYAFDEIVAHITSRTGRKSYDEERTRLTAEQADKQAMDNSERRGELAPLSWHEELISNYTRQLVAVLDVIPARIRQALPHLSHVDHARIEALFTRERDRLADRLGSGEGELLGDAPAGGGDGSQTEAAAPQ